MIPCLLGLLGCGGSSDSSVSNNFSSSEDSGPLAGVWIGSANGVTHTITTHGQENTCLMGWNTSDEYFTRTFIKIRDRRVHGAIINKPE
ncbi:hypothetical protein DESC_920053 [Desulfosarcina cetonica]|nr:hypothetical protein DESC_920053 [Desulfosarcina cetonica]